MMAGAVKRIGNQIAASRLAKTLPLIPTILGWLREQEEKAADLFISTGSADSTNDALNELLDNINYYGDLTVNQVRRICEKHSPMKWATAVRLVLLSSEPRLVPREIGELLVSSLPELDDAETVELCAQIIGGYLDDLSLPNYNALASFCALIRDTSTDPTELACLCGPVFLTHSSRDSITSGNLEHDDGGAAAAIMDLLVMESEVIFGQVASKRLAGGRDIGPPLGYRSEAQPESSPLKRNDHLTKHSPKASPMVASATRKSRNGNRPSGRTNMASPRGPAPPPPGMGGLKSPPSNTKNTDIQRMEDLRIFYEWRDPARMDRVESLFKYHTFVHIAEAINKRYGMVPSNWRLDLIQMKRNGVKGLDWFQHTNQTGLVRTIKDASSVIPRPKGSNSVKANSGSELSHVDRIINEICDTEDSYQLALFETLKYYVEQIRAIAQNRDGRDAQRQLGLSRKQIEEIFGWRLEDVVETSTEFLADLEVVDLVRSEPVNAEGGRAGLVADAFLNLAEQLHKYVPYVSSHKESLKAITSQVGQEKTGFSSKAVKKVASKARMITTPRGRSNSGHSSFSSAVGEKGTFEAIWKHISDTRPRLKGQTLLSILITPVQRVPRYRLLLKELIKKVDKDHPSAAKLKEALDAISVAADQINSALRQQEKLERFFGADTMITPSSSAVTPRGKQNDSKNKFVQLYNVEDGGAS